jgi:hypothetical protein
MSRNIAGGSKKTIAYGEAQSRLLYHKDIETDVYI